MLAIPQVTAIGTIEARTVLPSFLYLPNAQEFPAGSLGVPWDKQRSDQLIGEFARAHGSKVPARLVSSAKSWLCHSGVDRQSPILPWQAPADVKRVSPLEASSRYLSYMSEAQVASVKVEGRTFIHPTAVLFNGGVFKAGPLKERSLEVINTWLKTDGGSAAKELEGAELDLAVARGAAYYGWVRHGFEW